MTARLAPAGTTAAQALVSYPADCGYGNGAGGPFGVHVGLAMGEAQDSIDPTTARLDAALVACAQQPVDDLIYEAAHMARFADLAAAATAASSASMTGMGAG